MSILICQNPGRTWVIVSCALLLCMTALAQGDRLDEAVRGAEASRSKLHSAEVIMTCHAVQTEAFNQQYGLTGPPEDKTDTIHWAFKGEKTYREFEESPEDKQSNTANKLISQTTTNIFDGKDGYTMLGSKYTGRSKKIVQGNIEHWASTDFSPLDIGYRADTHWLAETLRSGKFHYVDASEDPAFGTLLHFLGEEHSGEQYSIWVAPQFGYLAVRVRDDIAMRGLKRAQVFETKQIVHKGDVWFPMQGSMRYLDTKDGGEMLVAEQTLTVTDLKLNEVPDSRFVPDIPVGAAMKDGETNLYWIVEANGGRRYVDISGAGKGKATNYSTGWLFMASVTSMLVLTVLAYVRWKRKQWAKQV